MKEISYKKILICGIIILFIGSTFVPGISGHAKKTDIQSSKEFPTALLGENNFINAYWKFDECSGSILQDSSGHNYDGTIHGATWTTGYSGCALDFDGVNDYVDLTAHAKELGINKTDDFIITFFFNAQSGDSGIIFSSTGYKNIPEFRIELLENGSILFKVWTALCGIAVSSGAGYNNGMWHNCTIYFNGITTDPTVHIYMDGDLDGYLTEWLCDIENSDFLDTVLGKRASDDTGHFDGKIDEFKFIKYERGNEQEPPIIDGPKYGLPDIEYDYTFTTNDPEGDDVWILIDWDDETEEDWRGPYKSGQTVTISHSWNTDGIYNLTAKSKDIWHHSRPSDNYVVRIGNQAPEKPTISGPKHGDANQELTYEFIATDFEEDTIRYIINWDDGETTETGLHPQNTSIQESHSWDLNGDYFITARAIDSHGKPGDFSDSYHIRIGDQAPTVTIDGPKSGKVGLEYFFFFIATDPEGDDVWYDIEWGDGNTITDIGPHPSGKTITQGHTWQRSDTFTIRARARDEFGKYGPWSDFEINIPRNKNINLFILERLYERFPKAFQIFNYLLGL
jgi:hypothetical protein